MAFPIVFTRSGAIPISPKSLMQASAWGAKASLSSTRSTSRPEIPARSRARRVAGTGPHPMISGAQPATPIPAIRASGFSPSRPTSVSRPMIIAAAPSTTALALPAVTMPPGSNAGGSRAMAAGLASSRMWVSCRTVIASVAPSRLTVTGSISSSNHFASRERLAFRCERSPNSSACSREIP